SAKVGLSSLQLHTAGPYHHLACTNSDCTMEVDPAFISIVFHYALVPHSGLGSTSMVSWDFSLRLFTLVSSPYQYVRAGPIYGYYPAAEYPRCEITARSSRYFSRHPSGLFNDTSYNRSSFSTGDFACLCSARTLARTSSFFSVTNAVNPVEHIANWVVDW